MHALPPIGGEDSAWPTLRAGHRRAISLMALSLAVMLAAGFAYVHPPTTEQPKSTEVGVVSAHTSGSLAIDSGPVVISRLTQVFRSPTMHYSIRFPNGWRVIPATQTSSTANVDELSNSSVIFTGTSQALASGQSPAGWIAGYLTTARANRCGLQEYMDFWGLVGLIYLGGCTSTDLPGRTYDAAVVIGGRGYSFTMKGTVGHEFFVSMLRSITFAQ
jgi:hypothetical protein